MPSLPAQVLLIATGGTIAGRSADPADNVGYRSAELGVEALVAAVPALAGVPLRTLQLAQVDSKDMDHALWQALVRSVAAALADPALAGIVITHGTDTLEETAYLLQRVLAPARPVVLTAAMRPASSLQADGPQNLLDAVTLARDPGARGVLVVIAGQVFAGDEVVKRDAYRIDAFGAGPAGPLALIEEGRVRALRPWPAGADGLADRPAECGASGGASVETSGGASGAASTTASVATSDPVSGAALIERPLHDWPRVAWITSHSGFDAALVDAAVAAGFDGLLLAGTGNGSLHRDLEAAAQRAVAAGVAVRLSTRCASGRVVGNAPRALPVSQAGSAAQARVELLLDLLAVGRR